MRGLTEILNPESIEIHQEAIDYALSKGPLNEQSEYSSKENMALKISRIKEKAQRAYAEL